MPTSLRPATPESDGLPTLPSEIGSEFDFGADSTIDTDDGLGNEPRRQTAFRSPSQDFSCDLEHLVSHFTRGAPLSHTKRRCIANTVVSAVAGALKVHHTRGRRSSRSRNLSPVESLPSQGSSVSPSRSDDKDLGGEEKGEGEEEVQQSSTSPLLSRRDVTCDWSPQMFDAPAGTMDLASLQQFGGSINTRVPNSSCSSFAEDYLYHATGMAHLQLHSQVARHLVFYLYHLDDIEDVHNPGLLNRAVLILAHYFCRVKSSERVHDASHACLCGADHQPARVLEPLCAPSISSAASTSAAAGTRIGAALEPTGPAEESYLLIEDMSDDDLDDEDAGAHPRQLVGLSQVTTQPMPIGGQERINYPLVLCSSSDGRHAACSSHSVLTVPPTAQPMTESSSIQSPGTGDLRDPLRSAGTVTSYENAFLSGVECAADGYSSASPSICDVTCSNEPPSTNLEPAGRGADPIGAEQGTGSSNHQTKETSNSTQASSYDGRKLSGASIRALLSILDSTTDINSLDVRPFVVYLCSGREREGQLRDWLNDSHPLFLSPDPADAVDIYCIEVIPSDAARWDTTLDELTGLSSVRVTEACKRLASHHRCIGVICTPPCRTFSCATHAGGEGPSPYRDILRRHGIPDSSGLLHTLVVGDNAIVNSCVAICKVCLDHGGFYIWENPAWRGDGSAFPIKGREAHCSLWQYPPAASFFEETSGQFVTFDQCETGQDAQKKTTLGCSPNVGVFVSNRFAGLQCTHLHHRALLGVKADGTFRTSGAEEFTPEMNRLLAMVVLDFWRASPLHPLICVPFGSPVPLGCAFASLEELAAVEIQTTFREYRANHPVRHASQAFVFEGSPQTGFCLLVLDRLRDDRLVFVPGGKQEPVDSSPHVTLRRELYEETGFLAPFGSICLGAESFGHFKGRYILHDYVIRIPTSQRNSFTNQEPAKHANLRWLHVDDIGRLPASAVLDRLHERALAALDALPSAPLVPVAMLPSCCYGFMLRLRLQRFIANLWRMVESRRAVLLGSALAFQSLWRMQQAVKCVAKLRTMEAQAASRRMKKKALKRLNKARRTIKAAIEGYVKRTIRSRRFAALAIQAAARGSIVRRSYRYKRLLPPDLHEEVKRLMTCPVAALQQRRIEIGQAVRRAQVLAEFDAAYAASFTSEAAAGLGSFTPSPTYCGRPSGSGIDFSQPVGTSQFTEATFAGALGGEPFQLPCSIHWDSCCGSAFLSPVVADWLLAKHPECITVVSNEVRSATVTVVNASSSVVIERVVNIHGMHLSGVALPDLENIRVVRGFRGGFLIGNPLHVQLGGRMDYRSMTYTFTGPDDERHDTPFRLLGSRLTAYSSDEGEVDAASSVASAVKPIAFTPKTVTIGKRTEQIIAVRVPSHVPTGATVLITPLEASDVRADIGVMVSHGLETVGPDGYVRVKVVNPHERKVTLPIMTPLARFTEDPATLAALVPEFDVDTIMEQANIGPEVTPEMRAMVAAMLESRRRVVASTPGYAQGLKCSIDTPSVDLGQVSAASCRQQRWSPGQLDALKGVIDEQVKAGYVARTQSEWNSRPLLVAKLPTKEWRLVVDFRDLNELTVGDRFPLPNIQDNLDRIGTAKWFTAIDLLAGFHQIEMDEASAHKTAFQTPWGQYMYIRMPMGLKSAPSTFCRVVNAMLQGLPAGVAIDYVDDVLIATDGTFEDHMRDVGMVFDRLLESGFTVKAKKCFIGYREVPYLGYLVGVNGVRLDPAKIQGILACSFESAVNDPSHFVGVVQHFARHIANFAILAAPFFDLKRAKGPDRARIVAEDNAGECKLRAAYTLLIDAISNDGFLARPDFTKPFLLATDASAVGAGAVLAQLDEDGEERPIAFWSHLFNKDERGGSVTDREGRALRDAVRHFRTYLTGVEFVVYTDHQALTWLMVHQHADNTVRQRWQSQLQAFTGMTISHRPGAENVVPDGISRLCALVAINKDADPRLRISCHPTPVEDIDALLRPAVEQPIPEGEAIFDAVTLGDVPDYVNPRSFMLTKDTPSSVESLAASRAYDSKVAQAASLLGISAPRPIVWPQVAEREVLPLSELTSKSQQLEQSLQPPAPAPLSQAPQSLKLKSSLNPRPDDVNVGMVLLSGHRLLLWRLGDTAMLPGGRVEHKHKTYREHALLYFARLFGSHTPESIDAIRNAQHKMMCHNTRYFVALLPVGYEVPVCTRADPWVDPVAGCLHLPPAGEAAWLDLEPLCELISSGEGVWPGTLTTSLTAAGISSTPDRTMIYRLVEARLALPRHMESLANVLRLAAPLLPTEPGTPSANSRYLSTNSADEVFPINGPCFHDCRTTAFAATERLREVASQDTLRVLGVDLEGTLRAGGVIETIQVAAYLPDGEPVVHVFDIQRDASPLTGQGYEDGAAPLRLLLEDTSYVKVFHCGRGDTSILASEYGIIVSNVFDNAVGDCVLRSSKAGAVRSLRKCVMEYAGVDLVLKDTIEHDPALWRQRPMSKERFEYAYTDVLHLREVFVQLSSRLADIQRMELAFELSRLQAPPLIYPITHGLFCRPDRVAFALHDGRRVLMVEPGGANERSVPSAPYDDAFHRAASDSPMKAGRAVWQALLGKPVTGLAKLTMSSMRKPVRLGGCLLYEMQVADVDGYLVSRVILSHNAALAMDKSAVLDTHKKGLPARLPSCWIDSVLLSACAGTGWNSLLSQYLLWATASNGPGVAAGDVGGEEKGGGGGADADTAAGTAAAAAGDAGNNGKSTAQNLDSAFAVDGGSETPPPAPPDTITVLVYDSTGNLQTGETSILTVEHQTHGSHLPEEPYATDRRAIDCALRALEIQLGPVLCFHTVPALSSALLRAAHNSYCLCRTSVLKHTTAVVGLPLDVPLQSLRTELDAAFAIRRETPTLRALVPSYRIQELKDQLRLANPLFSTVWESLVHTGWHRSQCFLADPGSEFCAKDLRPSTGAADTGPWGEPCAKDTHRKVTFRAPLEQSECQPPRHASVLVYHGNRVSINATFTHHENRAPLLVSLEYTGYSLTLEGARAAAVASAEASFPDGLEVQWISDDGAVARACGDAPLSALHRNRWCVFSDALEFAQLLEPQSIALVQAAQSHSDDSFYTDYTLTREYDASNPKPSAETATEREARLGANHAFDYTATPPTPSTSAPTYKPAIHPDDVISAAGAPPVTPLPTLADISAIQAVDPQFKHLYAHLKDPTAFRDADIPEGIRAATLRFCDRYRLIDGCLYYMDLMASTTVPEYDRGGRPLICVPSRFRTQLLELAHCAAGHQGVRPTIRRLREMFYWPGLASSARAFVRRCHVCARSKRHQSHAGSAQRVEDGERPWDVVTIDLYSYAGIDGYDHVVVMADGFTRGVEAVACQGTPTSSQVVDMIRHRIIRGHRTTPRIIRSDHGSIFVSSVCQEFCDAFGVQLRAGTPEHHATAGLAERFNRTMQEMLVAHRLSSGDPRWYLYLGDIELCYNTKTHDVFGVSPTYLEYGRDGRLPWAIAYFGVEGLANSAAGSAMEHISHLHSVWDAHRVYLAAHALQVKRSRDLKLDTDFKFKVHDRVLLRRLPGHPKWQEPYHGPYRIAECLPHDNYVLRDIDRSRLLADSVHVDRLVYYPELTIHGDAVPDPDEFFVRRILKRRLTDEGHEYLVRFVGQGPDNDLWLSRSALDNCRELVAAFDKLLDPLPPDDEPALEPTLADQPAEALPRSGPPASSRFRPDATRSATEPSNAPPDPPPAPPYGADGRLPNGSYAIDRLIDVSRPGTRGRLNVLIQFHGNDPTTGQPWAPEWHPLSRLGTSALKGEARLMEHHKYGSSSGPAPAEPGPRAAPVIINDYFGETSVHPALTSDEMDALDTLRPIVRAHLERLLIVPTAQRTSTDGPSSILRLRDDYYFMLYRDGRWVRIGSESASLTSAERRRCRTACRVMGLPDVAARL